MGTSHPAHRPQRRGSPVRSCDAWASRSTMSICPRGRAAWRPLLRWRDTSPSWCGFSNAWSMNPVERMKVLYFCEGYTDIRFVVGLSEMCDLTLAIPAIHLHE